MRNYEESSRPSLECIVHRSAVRVIRCLHATDHWEPGSVSKRITVQWPRTIKLSSRRRANFCEGESKKCASLNTRPLRQSRMRNAEWIFRFGPCRVYVVVCFWCFRCWFWFFFVVECFYYVIVVTERLGVEKLLVSIWNLKFWECCFRCYCSCKLWCGLVFDMSVK